MARASNSPPPPLGEAISSPDTHTPTRTDRETDRGGGTDIILAERSEITHQI